MPKITIRTLGTEEILEKHTITGDTTLATWIKGKLDVQELPKGFLGFYFLENDTFIPEESYDTHYISNDLAAYIPPKDFGVSAILIALTVASVGYSYYVINNLPDVSNPNKVPQRSSIYDASISGNQVKLGNVIPEIMGNMTIYPDLIATPYKSYVDNKIWAYFKLCIGQGSYLVDSANVKVGNTLLSELTQNTDYRINVQQPGELLPTFPEVHEVYILPEIGDIGTTQGIKIPYTYHKEDEDSVAVFNEENFLPFYNIVPPAAKTRLIQLDINFPEGIATVSPQNELSSAFVAVIVTIKEASTTVIYDESTLYAEQTYTGGLGVDHQMLFADSTTDELGYSATFPVPSNYVNPQVSVRIGTHETFSKGRGRAVIIGAKSYLKLEDSAGELSDYQNNYPLDTTMLLAIRVSDRLGSSSTNKISVPVSRSYTNALGNSVENSIGRALKILMDKAAPNIVFNETTLAALKSTWATLGWEFNHVFDAASTFDAVAKAILQTGQSTLTIEGGEFIPKGDFARSSLDAVFPASAILEPGIAEKWNLTPVVYDGWEVTYYNNEKALPLTLKIPNDGTTFQNPKKLSPAGITNELQALQYGYRDKLVTELRRKNLQFSTELQGQSLAYLDYISATRKSGEILNGIVTRITPGTTKVAVEAQAYVPEVYAADTITLASNGTGGVTGGGTGGYPKDLVLTALVENPTEYYIDLAVTPLHLTGTTTLVVEFGDDTQLTFSNVVEGVVILVPRHQYINAGTYPIKATLTDSFGTAAFFHVFTTDGITTNLHGTLNVTSAGNDVNVTAAIELFALESKFDMTINWGDGVHQTLSNQQPVDNSFSTTLSHAYVVANTSYDVVVIVIEKFGQNPERLPLTTTYTFNTPPQVGLGITFNAAADQTITFSDNSTDSDGTVVSRSWLFGDGGTSAAASGTHTYATNGVFPISLVVTDDDGASSSATQNHSVTTLPNQYTHGFITNVSDNQTVSTQTPFVVNFNRGDDVGFYWKAKIDFAQGEQQNFYTDLSTLDANSVVFTPAHMVGLLDGTHNLTLRAYNSAGQVQHQHLTPIIPITISNAASGNQTATFTLKVSTNATAASTEVLNLNDPDGAITNYKFDYDGAVFNQATSALFYDYGTTATGRNIAVTTTDALGGTTTRAVDFSNYATILPLITPTGNTVGTSIPVQWDNTATLPNQTGWLVKVFTPGGTVWYENVVGNSVGNLTVAVPGNNSTIKIKVKHYFAVPEGTVEAIRYDSGSIISQPSAGGTLTNSAPIIVTADNTIVENLCFQNLPTQVAIQINGASNVIVRNCLFKNVNVSINAEAGSDNLEVEGNFFDDVGAGLRLLSSANPNIHHNTGTRMGVYATDIAVTGYWSANFIQLNGCTSSNANENVYDNIVDWNYGTTIVTDNAGHGWAVDGISVFASGGTSSTTRLKVARNIIRGIKGKGTQAAGGLVAGDSNGDWTEFYENKVLNYGQYAGGMAFTKNTIFDRNKLYNEQGHAHNGFNQPTNLIKHPQDGANADSGFGFVFSPFGQDQGGTCFGNSFDQNDSLGYTYWGYKGMNDAVDAAGGTLTENAPGTCTNSVYTNNNVALNTAGHPALVAMVSEDPFTTLAIPSLGYFDRTQTH